jgi:hypothetical protein
LYLNVFINRSHHLSDIDRLIRVIKKELKDKGSQQTKSEVAGVIRKLQQIDKYREALLIAREEIMSIDNPNMWLQWTEEVYIERLEIFFLLYKDNEDTLDWLMESVRAMVLVTAGYSSPGYSYTGHSTRYLNILVSDIVSLYINIDWEETISSWKIINGNLNLFNYLDTTTKPKIVGQLSNLCELSSSVYNQLLREHYDLVVRSHREGIFNRWEVIDSDFRRAVVEKLPQYRQEIVDECNELLMKYLKTNPHINFLNEFVEWEIEDVYRKVYLKSLIENIPLEICANWVSEEVSSMNQVGFHKWKGYTVELAVSFRKVNFNSLKGVLETALDLGQARAKLALTILSQTTLSKTDLKRFREKIISNYDEYPELVNQFGYRF